MTYAVNFGRPLSKSHSSSDPTIVNSEPKPSPIFLAALVSHTLKDPSPGFSEANNSWDTTGGYGVRGEKSMDLGDVLGLERPHERVERGCWLTLVR